MDRLEWCLPFTFRFTLQRSSTDAHDLIHHLYLGGRGWLLARVRNEMYAACRAPSIVIDGAFPTEGNDSPAWWVACRSNLLAP
jgi:hypothetical protein